MGEFEAAGEIVTGGMMARAVDPGSGGHGTGPGHGLCLNCGTALVASHCHRCGQTAHVHRTVGAIGHDIAHGVFHFEGKAWRTLPMLAFRPGALTRRYVAGERARFVSPMAMFLFSVFLMFAVVANLPAWNFGDADFMRPDVAVKLAEARTQLAEDRAAASRKVAAATTSLAEARAQATRKPAAIDSAERRLARAREALSEATVAEKAVSFTDLPDIKAAPGSPGGNWLEQKFQHARENPKLLFYKMKTSAYKFSWALIPLSLPFIWLMFPLRRDVGLYDHAVFATYSLSFMSLLTVVLGLLGLIGIPGQTLILAGLLIPPIHIYKQLKGAYGLGRMGALWRTFLMINFIGIITMMFALLLLYLGVAD